MVLAAGAVLLYRQTNPPLPRYVRVLLGGLRLVALLALFAALFQPVLSFSRVFERPSRVTLLLDHSESMGKQESGKTRRARLDSLLSSAVVDNLKNNADINFYYFGANLSRNARHVDSSATAIGDVLHELNLEQAAEKDDYWLLFTDGNSNAGRAPVDAATGLEPAVVTIDMSGGRGNFDIGIDDVEFNTIVFVGSLTEVTVDVSWRDALDREFTLELVDSAQVLDSQTMRISQETGQGKMTLKYIPSRPGQRLLKLCIPQLSGEENISNNERTFSVKVLKSRLLVLLAADHPDYEVGFLKRYFDQSDKYDLEFIATGNKAGNLSGRLPSQQTELNRYDLVILYDPDPAALASRQEIIRSYLNERGGSVWLSMGRQFSQGAAPEAIRELLPFSQSSPQPLRYVEYHGEPAEEHLFHPAIRLADNLTEIREAWANLPPFKTLVLCDHVHPDGVILAHAQVSGKNLVPLLGYSRHGAGKLLAQAGLPFWPWHFINLGLGEDEELYSRFVDGAAGWLTVSDDMEPVKIYPEKTVFTRGEPVSFYGHAYDPGYRPLPGVTGAVTLQAQEQTDEITMDLVSYTEGKFRAVFSSLAPGQYSYSAQFEKDGRTLKQEEGTVQVESFSLEEYDQSGNPSLLAALARKTGGNYYTYEEFDRVWNALDLSAVTESRSTVYPFWNRFWLLLLMVGALSLEWLIRKANQLV